MDIGMIPRVPPPIRRENAQSTVVNQAGYRGPGFGCNVGPKADARGQQSRVSRLNRYPSPSLRSGLFMVRPTLFPDLMHHMMDDGETPHFIVKNTATGMKYSPDPSDAVTHAASVTHRGGVIVVPAPAPRGQRPGRI